MNIKRLHTITVIQAGKWNIQVMNLGEEQYLLLSELALFAGQGTKPKVDRIIVSGEEWCGFPDAAMYLEEVRKDHLVPILREIQEISK